MQLVVNTNRIIAALIKDGLSRKILTHGDADFLSIEFSAQELSKQKSMILHKAHITEEEFDRVLEKLKNSMVSVPDALIQLHMGKAKEIMDHIDPDDTPFIAAALATDADIWSDDRHFEQQSTVRVWKTLQLTHLVSDT